MEKHRKSDVIIQLHKNEETILLISAKWSIGGKNAHE
jgi:hypothetical protein